MHATPSESRPVPSAGRSCLYTIGYEGARIEDFVARLKAAGVLTVVDIRQIPLSRKKGFSKTAFREALARAGLGYEHLSSLGCPKPIRDAYKADADWGRYERAFSAHLATQCEAVRDLWGAARERSSCLVCFERDFTRCHRSIVADAAWRFGALSVEHLSV